MTNRLPDSPDEDVGFGTLGLVLRPALSRPNEVISLSDVTTLGLDKDGLAFGDVLRKNAEVDEDGEEDEVDGEEDEEDEEEGADGDVFWYTLGSREQWMDANGRGKTLEDKRFDRGRRPKRTDKKANGTGGE